MQMMAHWAGTGLHPVQGHVKTRHLLVGEITGEVNSYHGFTLAACPTDFEVLARSEDGAIEGIRHQSLPWEGWMWHPEREPNFSEHDIQRLKALFS
jgi:putative glutamine amidotransferase